MYVGDSNCSFKTMSYSKIETEEKLLVSEWFIKVKHFKKLYKIVAILNKL
jgi:hypothetical protein